MTSLLFPTDLPERSHVRFGADGFPEPVTGVIYRSSSPPTCGMPLGGISTGCLDVGADGTFGYCSIFNSHLWRRGPMNVPFLGLSVGKECWVLSTLGIKGDPEGEIFDLHRRRAKRADNIRYWGHYPVVDMEYETDAPVGVGLRAWSPFVPGDTEISNTPGSVFEVRLRNLTDATQKGRLVFSFPGPSAQEVCGNNQFTHRRLDGKLAGVEVTNSDGIGYVIGMIGKDEALLRGGDLGVDGGSWSHFAETGRIHLSLRWRLPYATILPPEANQAGASLAVEYELEAREERTVRFVLAWYSPEWKGIGNPMAGGRSFSHMYAGRFKDALQVAEFLADNHETLLKRILAWQQAIYSESELPAWLRDGLVNIFHLFAEDSFWAQAKPPIGDWCRKEDGLFAMNDAPRSCSDMGANSEQFVGFTPTAYFFPKLGLSTLRAYKAYQTPEGAVPWSFGAIVVQTAPCDLVDHSHAYMSTMNGACYADLVDRLWLCTGDDALLKEFYPSVKKSVIYTMELNRGPDGVVSMPDRLISSIPYERETEWFEFCEWKGIVPHVGGIHLAQLRLAERMAERVGDTEFAERCREWIARGTASIEGKAWNGNSYLAFREDATGRKSEAILSNGLDGQWVADFNATPPVFREDRIKIVLDTVKRLNCSATKLGVAHFVNADGTPTGGGEAITEHAQYNVYDFFPSVLIVLGATLMYRGDAELGLDICRRCMEHIVCREGRAWDMPNIINGKTGEVVFGNDYYQMMVLWSLIAAMKKQDISGPCKPGGLVHRVIQAGKDTGGSTPVRH